MTWSNGNIFCITGPLCGEFTGHRWIPHTKASDTDLLFDVFFYLCLNKWLSKQSRRWWFETPLPPLWCHCNESMHASPVHSSLKSILDWYLYKHAFDFMHEITSVEHTCLWNHSPFIQASVAEANLQMAMTCSLSGGKTRTWIDQQAVESGNCYSASHMICDQ